MRIYNQSEAIVFIITIFSYIISLNQQTILIIHCIDYYGGYFIGEFNEGVWNGQGTEYNSYTSEKYIGQFKDGRKNGQGECFYKEGGKYSGDWKDNRIHGQGTLFSADGQILNSGKWKYNEFAGSE